jgi:hypothetical protein
MSGFVLITAAGCASDPIKLTSITGPGMRFDKGGSTYSWLKQKPRSSRDLRSTSPNLHRRFTELVDSELRKRGYQKVADGTGDFWIDYRFRRRVVGNPYDPGHDRYIAYFTFDVIDPESEETMWQRTAEVEINRSAPPDELRALFQETVARMLEPIPPCEPPVPEGEPPRESR